LIIHFVRHCETKWNIDGKYSGHLDSPISKIGKSQTKQLAKYFRLMTDVDIISSDLGRAKFTAEAISRMNGATVMLEPRLREIDFGILSGLTEEQIIEINPTIWKSYKMDPYNTQFPKGESGAQALTRAIDLISELSLNTFRKNKILVTHGSILRLILGSVLGINNSDFRNKFLPVENGSITTCVFNEKLHKNFVFNSGKLLTYNKCI